MSLVKINAALLEAYRAIGLDLPTMYEMRDYRPPASSIWVKVTNMPAARSVRTMGDGGEDDITGVFQIDVHVPENSGTAAILRPVDKIHNHFHPGRRFTYEGQQVKVLRSSLTPVRKLSDSASYRSSVSVFWTSPTVR